MDKQEVLILYKSTVTASFCHKHNLRVYAYGFAIWRENEGTMS